LGVVRSDVAERVKGTRPMRGPQIGEGDPELTAEIRRPCPMPDLLWLPRIAALIEREQRSGGTPVNAKRVYRLMK